MGLAALKVTTDYNRLLSVIIQPVTVFSHFTASSRVKLYPDFLLCNAVLNLAYFTQIVLVEQTLFCLRYQPSKETALYCSGTHIKAEVGSLCLLL